jgi:hypothetical protein
MKIYTEEMGTADIVVAEVSLKSGAPDVLENIVESPETSIDTGPDAVDTGLLKMLGFWLRF